MTTRSAAKLSAVRVRWLTTVFATVLALAVAASLLLPVALLLGEPLGMLSFGQKLPTSTPLPLPPIAWHSLLVTFVVAGLAAGIAVSLGFVAAVILVLTDLPGRKFWATMLLVPWLCPPTVWAISQLYCYGPGGVVERLIGAHWAAIREFVDRGHYVTTCVTLAQIYMPVAFLLIGRGLGGRAPAGFAAARLLLTGRALLWWLVRAVRQELLTSYVLVFVLAVGSFAVPNVWQCRLYSQELYLQLSGYLNPAGAIWLAAPLCAILVPLGLALIGYDHGLADQAAASDHGPSSWCLGRGRSVVTLGLGFYVFLSTGLPVAAITVECRSLSQFVQAAGDASPEMANSIWCATAAAVFGCAVGLLVTLNSIARRARVLIEALLVTTLAVPPILIAIAYSQFYNAPWPIDLSPLGADSALSILGHTSRVWPFAAALLFLGRQRLLAAWSEAARLAGLSPMRRWRWITGPLLYEHLAAATLVGFVQVMGDVEISQLLAAPGAGTLGLRLFTFLHFGPTHVAASLALMLLLLTTLPVFGYFLLTDRWFQP